MEKAKRKKMLMVVLIVAVLAVAGASVGLGVYLKGVGDYRKAVGRIQIGEIDIAEVSDGTYTGSCDVGMISAEVSVTVASGVMTDIRLVRHDNDRGAPAEKIVGEILARQSLAVDAISGATNSSKVILKAVENALRKGLPDGQ